MARGERLGRLRLGDVSGGDHPALPRLPDRRQPAPLGRMVVLNDLEVDVELADGSVVNLRENGRFLDFTLDMGLPSWRHELNGVDIEKSIVVPSRQNIVYCTFRSLGDGQPVRLRLRPLINFRPVDAPNSCPWNSIGMPGISKK